MHRGFAMPLFQDVGTEGYILTMKSNLGRKYEARKDIRGEYVYAK